MELPLQVLVTDARTASGAWKLQIAASQIGEPRAHRVVEDAQLTIAAVDVVCAQQPCRLPRYTAIKSSVPFSADASSPVTFLAVNPTPASGRLLVTLTLRLHIPADAYNGDYQFTFAVTAVEGA